MRLINFSKPVITYIFSCGRNYAFSHFKPSVWNRAETELKCNTDIRKNLIPLAFYHTQTGGA